MLMTSVGSSSQHCAFKGRAPPHHKLSLEDFSAELDENALHSRDPSWNEDTTSSSSSFILFDSSDNKEEGEEMNQLVLNMRRRGANPVVAPT